MWTPRPRLPSSWPWSTSTGPPPGCSSRPGRRLGAAQQTSAPPSPSCVRGDTMRGSRYSAPTPLIHLSPTTVFLLLLPILNLLPSLLKILFHSNPNPNPLFFSVYFPRLLLSASPPTLSPPAPAGVWCRHGRQPPPAVRPPRPANRLNSHLPTPLLPPAPPPPWGGDKYHGCLAEAANTTPSCNHQI